MIHSASSCAIAVLFCSSVPGIAQTTDDLRRDTRPEGRFIEDAVFEGVGFAGVRFGDSAEDVETILGGAAAGSPVSRMYADSRFKVHFEKNAVSGFTFHDGFRGMLATSDLGIGDWLEDVESAYGEILSQRPVDELGDWVLDRTLLTRRGGADQQDGSVLKLCYYSVGLCVLFDDEGRINGFDLTRKTGYAARAFPDLEELIETLDGPFVEETIEEGVGVAGVKFKDSMETVLEVLGEPSCGTDDHFTYSENGMWVKFRDGTVYGFSFSSYFLGTRSGSDLGIGDSLNDVTASLGEILKEQVVDDPNDWWLDRTFVKRRDGPRSDNGFASKLYYRSSGLVFFFDAHDQVTSFAIYPERLNLTQLEQRRCAGTTVLFEELDLDGLAYSDSPEFVEEHLGTPSEETLRWLRYLDLDMSFYFRNDGLVSVLFHSDWQGPLPFTETHIGGLFQAARDVYSELRMERADGTVRRGQFVYEKLHGEPSLEQLSVYFRGETLAIAFDEAGRIAHFRIYCRTRQSVTKLDFDSGE